MAWLGALRSHRRTGRCDWPDARGRRLVWRPGARVDGSCARAPPACRLPRVEAGFTDVTFLNQHALWPNAAPIVYLLVALVDTHITTTCVTLYLHRCQTHRSITFNPMVEHFMRFWLWVRTAMPTREWVAVHRCHHANVDTDKDPHSPIVYGIWRVVFRGTALYHTAAHNKALVEQYGKGTPNDIIERRLYEPFSVLGPTFTLITNLLFFGTWGFAMWLVEMAWIPFFAAGVINGLGHWWGYRNFET